MRVFNSKMGAVLIIQMGGVCCKRKAVDWLAMLREGKKLPEGGLEPPPSLQGTDFESVASADSATPASGRRCYRSGGAGQAGVKVSVVENMTAAGAITRGAPSAGLG